MTEPQTLQDLLVRAAAREGTAHEETAHGLRFLDRRERVVAHSWAEIHLEATRVAGALVARGVRPGDRTALVFPTGPGFVHAFFAILLAGAVPVPLYPPVRLGRLDEYYRRTAAMLSAAGARLVLAEGRVARLLGLAVARTGIDIATLESLIPSTRALPTPDPDALALVQFSSGTTHHPKPVALSQRAVLAQTRILNSFWPDSRETHHCGMSWLPLYHDMGLIGCIFPALERPGTLTLLGPELFVARPALWLRALSSTRATISPAPNFAFALATEKIQDHELEGVDLSAWRVALVGAETVVPAVLDAFAERFAPWGLRREALTPVYGLSEASLAVTFSALDKPFTAPRFDRGDLALGQATRAEDGIALASLGRPLPGFELHIAAQDDGPRGEPLAEDRIGRLWIRGPSLMDGYLGRPEDTAEALVDGWLDTGDLGFLHQGDLFLTGRAKDVLILRGRNYGPDEVERAAWEVDGVRKGCVVAVSRTREEADGGSATEELWIFAEHARDAEIAPDALADAVVEAVLAATGLRAAKVRVLSPGTLPRTSSGKLRRAETLRRFLQDVLHPPRKVTPWLLAGEMARSALARRGWMQEPDSEEE